MAHSEDISKELSMDELKDVSGGLMGMRNGVQNTVDGSLPKEKKHFLEELMPKEVKTTNEIIFTTEDCVQDP